MLAYKCEARSVLSLVVDKISSAGFIPSRLPLLHHPSLFTTTTALEDHHKGNRRPITKMTTSPARLRSLYRAILRELPPRPILAAPRTPLHTQLRATFSSSGSSSAATANEKPEVAAELITYLRSQRTYATLLERYNPGMDMDETERVRLTARRVGMDLPKVAKD